MQLESWLAHLKTTSALALSGLKLIVSALQLALFALQVFVRLLYTFLKPLCWPIYKIYAFVVFLLSPLWIIIKLGLGVVSYVTDLVISFKVRFFTASSTKVTSSGGLMMYIIVPLLLCKPSELAIHYRNPIYPSSPGVFGIFMQDP
jgi:hypothetical protein